MKHLRAVLLTVLSAFPAAFFLQACANNPPQNRELLSITIAPSSAPAQGSPGQAQFTATGYYNAEPYTVTPQPAQWGVCQNNTQASNVTVFSAGLAQCGSGASGTYTVFAFDITECSAITVCGGGCTIRGTAQLTCP